MFQRFVQPFFLSIILVFGSASGYSQDWQELSAPPFSGRHHGIGFAHGGYGYVISGSQSRDVWKYTPVSDSWEQLPDYSPIYRGYGIGDMVEGKEYFGFGFVEGPGQNGRADDLWVFDAETETSTQLANCPCEPRTHPAFVAFDDKIYMGLGSGEMGNLGDWWEYDIPSDTWSEKSTFIGANRHHPYQFRIDDYIYVGSGHQSDWYRYDPSNDTWTEIASHPSYIRVAGIQFAYGGKGYTLSGVADYNDSTHEPMPTGEFWEYDPVEDSWTELPAHPGMSRWASASFIIDGWLYMVAGQTYDGQTANYRYQLEETPSGIEDIKRDQLMLRPMPFVDHIILPEDFQWKNARLIDLRGAVLESPVILGNTLQIPSVPTGIYLLELQNEDKVYRQRVIRE